MPQAAALALFWLASGHVITGLCSRAAIHAECIHAYPITQESASEAAHFLRRLAREIDWGQTWSRP